MGDVFYPNGLRPNQFGAAIAKGMGTLHVIAIIRALVAHAVRLVIRRLIVMLIGPFTVYLVALTRTLAGIGIAQNSSKGVSYSTNVVLITSINISPQRTPICISVFQ